MGNPRHVQKAIKSRNNKHGIEDIEIAKEVKKIGKNKRKQKKQSNPIDSTKWGIEAETITETETETEAEK